MIFLAGAQGIKLADSFKDGDYTDSSFAEDSMHN